MLELALLVGKILFLVVLYWFVFTVVRSAARDLGAGATRTTGAVASQTAAAVVDAASSHLPGAASADRGPVAASGPGRGWWALTVVSSPALDPGWAYEFPPGGRMLLGRSEQADVVLHDTFVSTQHARVRALPGALEIEDLGSTNGTFVNGREIQGPSLVGPGDEVSVGDTLFRVEAR